MKSLYRILSALVGLAALATLAIALIDKELLDQYTPLALPQVPLLLGLALLAVTPAIAALLSRSTGSLITAAGPALFGLILTFVAWQQMGVLVVVALMLDVAWGMASVAAGMNEAADEFVAEDPAPIKRGRRA